MPHIGRTSNGSAQLALTQRAKTHREDENFTCHPSNYTSHSLFIFYYFINALCKVGQLFRKIFPVEEIKFLVVEIFGSTF